MKHKQLRRSGKSTQNKKKFIRNFFTIMKSGAPLLGLAKSIYYDFLLSFMLTGCDGCIESDSKWRREAYLLV